MNVRKLVLRSFEKVTRRITPEIRLYPSMGRISPVYLADAAPEAALAAGWLALSFGRAERPRRAFRRPIATDPKLASRAVRAAGMATTPLH